MNMNMYLCFNINERMFVNKRLCINKYEYMYMNAQNIKAPMVRYICLNMNICIYEYVYMYTNVII